MYDFFEGRKKVHSGEILGQIPHRPIHEGSGFFTNYNTGLSHESEMRQLKSSADIDLKELIKDPEKVYQVLDKLAQDQATLESKLIIDGISEITEKTGNVAKRKGDFNENDFLDIIRKMEIDFDQDGNPRLPQILVSPSDFLKIEDLKFEENVEFKNKFEELILIKRREWNDRENNRKLV